MITDLLTDSDAIMNRDALGLSSNKLDVKAVIREFTNYDAACSTTRTEFQVRNAR